MEKLFTDKEYAQKAIEANYSGQKLYIYVHSIEEEEKTKDIAELIIAPDNYYICYQKNYTDCTINPNYEQEEAQKAKERIAKLSLTKREVFLALYHAKNITPDMLKAQIQSPEALIEFEYANDYYRGNPLIDTIGSMLGYTSEDLDYLFINKEFPNG